MAKLKALLQVSLKSVVLLYYLGSVLNTTLGKGRGIMIDRPSSGHAVCLEWGCGAEYIIL